MSLKKSANIVDVYTLSPLQEGILFHSIYQKESSAYFVQMAHRMQGELQVNLVRESMQKLVDRHDSLRTSFVYEEMDQPLQVVLRQRELPFYSEDIRHLPSREKQEEYLEAYKKQDRLQYFDLTHDCLIRAAVFQLSDQEYEFIWSCHHIIIDGWCLKTIEYEFFAYYGHAREEKKLELPPAPQYKKYIQWLDQSSEARSTAFWQNYLNDYATPARIPQLQANTEPLVAFDNNTYILDIPEKLNQQLVDMAQANRTTVNNIVRSVWGILLAKYNDQRDAVFGAVVSGRPPQIPEAGDIVGLFINTVPVRVAFDTRMGFDELLKKVTRESIESEEFHHALLAEIQNLTEHKNQLLDHILVFENYPTNPSVEGLSVESEEEEGNYLKLINESVFSQNHYPFYVIVGLTPQLKFNFYYNRSLYSEAQVRRMGEQLVFLMKQCIGNNGLTIDQLALVEEESPEYLDLRDGFNDTHRDFELPASVKTLFEQTVEKHGDSLAICSDNKSYTYHEVHQISNDLAAYLEENLSDDTPDGMIGILTNSPEYAVISMLATVKTGRAFVPLYPNLPAQVIQNVLQESGISFLIVESALLDRIDSFSGGLFAIDIQLEMLESGKANLERGPAATDPLYVIYSSGTTGQPKGVEVSHGSLLNYVAWFKAQFQFGSGQKGALLSSHAYDLGYTTIWGCLLNGASLYLPDPRIAREPQALLSYLLEQQISFLKLTPSHFKVLMAAPKIEELKDSALQLILLGGEKIHPPSIADYWAINPNTRFVNHYGPTETTIGVLTHSLDPGAMEAYRQFPVIGRPIANCKAFIFDDGGVLLPIGAVGNLHIAGAGLALGYWSNPELTKQKFAKNAWGERCYKTGDKARRHENGTIEFLGRADEEVKIRGYRVNINDIARVIHQHPEVKFANVQALENGEGEVILAAYIQYERDADPAVLTNYLKGQLPEYMLPGQLIKIAEPPLTANGKLDVKRLKKMTSITQKREVIPPANETEELLLHIWKEVLGKQEISTDDDFFDLGGHSLKAVQIISRIIVEFKLTLAVKDLFDHTTICTLAKVIDGQISMKKSDQSVDEVII